MIRYSIIAQRCCSWMAVPAPDGEFVPYRDVANLIEAVEDFVLKVRTGRARSVDSYQKFSDALAGVAKSGQGPDALAVRQRQGRGAT